VRRKLIGKIFARNTSGRETCAELAVKETIPTMKKLIILTPLLAVALALTSCTTVVEKPAPTTTTTTTSTTKKAVTPSTTQETTVRSSGNY
jgi:hypothetical protein